MARYRNARYAPEALERKLSPSATGIAPTPVLLDTMVAPGANATAVTILDAGYGSTSTMNSVDYIPYVALTDPSTSSPDLYAGDYLLVDSSGDDTLPAPPSPSPYPGEGLPPLDPPPNPVGPVVPA